MNNIPNIKPFFEDISYAVIDRATRKGGAGVTFFTEQAAVSAAMVSMKNRKIPPATFRRNSAVNFSFSSKPKVGRTTRKIDSSLALIYFETKQSLIDAGGKSASIRGNVVDARLPFQSRVQQLHGDNPITIFEACLDYSGSVFVPSSNLVSFWLEGLNSVRREAKKAQISITNTDDFAHYSAELVRVLDSVLSNFAKLKAYDGGRYHLTFGGKILSTVETLIVDELLIPPSYSSAFIRELHGLLLVQTTEQPRFRGRWGELIVDEKKELIFALLKRKRRTLAQVLRE